MIDSKLTTIFLVLGLGLCPLVYSQNSCASVTGTKYIAAPPSCAAWIYCKAGREHDRGTCPSPYVFNSATGDCDYVENVTCPSNGTASLSNIICVNRPNKSYIPNPENCYRYFYCSSNIASEGQCPTDYFFNPKALVCQLSPNYICPEPTADTTCSMISRNAFLPDVASCSSYILCYKGHKIPGTCPSPLVFNGVTGLCDEPANTKCALAGTMLEINITEICKGTTDATPFAKDPASCTGYYYCKNGKALHGVCKKSLYFEAKTQVCVKPASTTCTIVPCSGVIIGKFAASPDTCTEYFYCSPKGPIAGYCPTGRVFNEAKQICDLPENFKCTDKPTITNICVNKPDKSFVANPNDCHGYFYCMKNSAFPGRCSKDYIFNATGLVCQYAVNYICPSSPYLASLEIQAQLTPATGPQSGSETLPPTVPEIESRTGSKSELETPVPGSAIEFETFPVRGPTNRVVPGVKPKYS